MNELEQIFGISGSSEKSESIPVSDTTVKIPPVKDSSLKEGEPTVPMSEMANLVMRAFRTNSDHRKMSGMDEKLLYALRANECRFDQEQESKMRMKFPASVADKLFAPITSTKNRAAKSMLVDLANQIGSPLFKIEPTPLPDVPSEVAEEAFEKVMSNIKNVFMSLEKNGVNEIPPEMMEYLNRLVVSATNESYDEIENSKESFARNRAKRMEKKVWDLMCEGGFSSAFMDVLTNVCVYGTGVMVGPTARVVSSNKCVEDKKNGTKKYKRINSVKLVYESVNPMDCYPAPDAKDVSDGPFCMRVKYTADELWRFSDSKAKTEDGVRGCGWIQSVVRNILSRHPSGGLKLNIVNYDSDRRTCENNGFADDVNDCTFEGVRCFMPVRGSVLIQMGIVKNHKGKTIDQQEYYKTETIVIDNRVVYCTIFPDEFAVPVSKCAFYDCPGSWWGDSIAEKLKMTQCVLNNCIRAMMENMAASSNSVWWVNDVQRLVNKSPQMKIKAGMTIGFGSSMVGNTGAPIGAINVPSTANELLSVWQRMQSQADLDSGLPAYTEGQSAGQSGALRTASGLAVFTEAANRGLKMVMTTIDHSLISNVARMTADWVLIHDDDMDLKGDVNIRSVGLIGKIMKAQRDQQRMQLFDMVQKSPILSQIAGIKGLIALFRPAIEDIDVNPDDVLPSKGKIEEMELVQQIKQVFDATQASQGVQENSAAIQGPHNAQGMQGEVANEPAPGSVAERRNVA